MLLTILLLPLRVLVAQEASALLLEGHQGQARVIQVQGKNYVEVEALSRITGGSLRFAGNQIILTLPGGTSAAPQTDQSAPAAALSRPFLSAGIETMREILEWHAALKNGIERGYPLSDVWFGHFSSRTALLATECRLLQSIQLRELRFAGECAQRPFDRSGRPDQRNDPRWAQHHASRHRHGRVLRRRPRQIEFGLRLIF